MKKRLICLLLVLGLLLGLLAFSAGAEEQTYTLTYSVENGEACVTGYQGTMGRELVIPAELGGYPVTKIGSLAFIGSDCDQITTLYLDVNLQEIESIAFMGCSNLKTVYYSASWAEYQSIVVSDSGNTPIERASVHYYNGAQDLCVDITGTDCYDFAFQVLELTNQEREKEGLAPLAMDEALLETAMLRAAESILYFAHTRPDLSSCYTAFPANGGYNGENLSIGWESPEEVVEAWMNSESHRENLLDEDFEIIGIGCFYHNGYYSWSQCFQGSGAQVDPAVRRPDQQATKSIYLGSELFLESFPVMVEYDAGMTVGDTQTAEVTDAQDYPYFIYILDNTSFDWRSSAPEVVSVENGTLTANSPGTAEITLKAGEYTSSFSVTVSQETQGSEDSQEPVPIRFTDVKDTDWFAPYVYEAYDRGLMTGTGDNTFSPRGTTTRAMFVQILYAMSGKPEVEIDNPFTDVPPEQWYAHAVQWAYENGVTGGISETTFGPNHNVTREQVAVFLYAYYGRPPVSGDLSGFMDAGRVHSWAYDAMVWATQNGVISGSDNGDGTKSLNPQGEAIRAETATMMVGFAKLMDTQ